MTLSFRNPYKNLSASERDLIFKLILCTILSTFFSWAIGDPYSPTTAVTANLFLYCDRGFCGSIRYATRRVLVQIVQGILVLAVIFPCKYYDLPLSDSLLIVLAACGAICIGLPINYKHQYSPLNCTLANACFIIACASVRNFTSFPYRVIECIAGGIIGYIVNFIVFPQKSRYKATVEKIINCALILIRGEDLSGYKEQKRLLDADFVFLTEDREKGSKKHRISNAQFNYLTAHRQLLNHLENYQNHYSLYHSFIREDLLRSIERTYKNSVQLHLRLVENLNDNDFSAEGNVSLSDINPISPAEICLSSGLIQYVEALNLMLVSTGGNCLC